MGCGIDARQCRQRALALSVGRRVDRVIVLVVPGIEATPGLQLHMPHVLLEFGQSQSPKVPILSVVDLSGCPEAEAQLVDVEARATISLPLGGRS